VSKRVYQLIFLFSFIIAGFGARAQPGGQIHITGTTLDSLTHLPLPFVAVMNIASGGGTTSDENGIFSINAGPGDTLQISMVGYFPKLRIVYSDKTSMIVLLRENAQMLKPVVVYGSFQPNGSKLWKNSVSQPKIFRNPAGPGSGYMVETFGPGVNIGGALSYFTKGAVEKRKIKKERERNAATETYRNVITSQETKDFFMKTFAITEDEYSKRIEGFNKSFPDVVYITNKDEIIAMLVNFFAQKK
jgi:hypothetical protein